jgi:radical SAM protein with 4Fe4S-binding SPASM domain
MARENRYISINGDRVWVKGARRSALYDTQNYKIYPLNEQLTRILSLSQQQIPLDDIYLHLNSGDNGVKEKVIEAVLAHPFLSLSQTPTAFPEAKNLEPICKPDFLWLELTQKCNLRCLHCYAEAGGNIKDAGLSPGDYKRIIQEASALGFKSIQFTGGEATLHPDLMELLGYAKACGYELIELYTNAFNLPNGLLDLVTQNGIKIATSFYSHQSKTHDRITGRKGSLEQTAGNIQKMVKLKIPLRVGIIKLRYNQNDTEKARAYLISLGVDPESIDIDTMRPSGRGCNPELIPDERDFSQEPHRHSIKQNENGLTIPGTCWNGKVALTPSGDVIPCVFARDLVVGNVLKSSLKDILSSSKLKELWGITLDKVEVCQDCEYRYACFDCRALAYLTTDNLSAKVHGCTYDPYTGQWKESGLKEESIMAINDGYKPVRNELISTRVIDGETILFNTETNALHTLNLVASEIWNCCDGDHSFEDIVDGLFDKFEASRDQIEKDVQKALQQFQELALLESN